MRITWVALRRRASSPVPRRGGTHRGSGGRLMALDVRRNPLPSFQISPILRTYAVLSMGLAVSPHFPDWHSPPSSLASGRHPGICVFGGPAQRAAWRIFSSSGHGSYRGPRLFGGPVAHRQDGLEDEPAWRGASLRERVCVMIPLDGRVSLPPPLIGFAPS